MRTHLTALAAVLAAAAACSKADPLAPAPPVAEAAPPPAEAKADPVADAPSQAAPKPPPAPAAPSSKPPPGLGPTIALSPLSGPLNADPSRLAEEPALVAGKDGKLVAAWREGNQVLAKRWSGSSWEDLGLVSGKAQSTGAVLLAVETDGSVLAGFLEAGAGDFNELRVRRLEGRVWRPTFESTEPRAIYDVQLAGSASGALAVWRQREGDQASVQVRGLDKNSPFSGQLAAGEIAAAPALAGGPSVEPAIAWVQRKETRAKLEVRRWNAQRREWVKLPRPGGADPGSTVALAYDGEGALWLAVGGPHGLRELRRYATEEDEWTDEGVPDLTEAQVRRLRLVGTSAGAVLAWPLGPQLAVRTRGDKIRGSWSLGGWPEAALPTGPVVAAHDKRVYAAGVWKGQLRVYASK